MKTATLSLSLDNEALYRGCAIEEVGGRLVPEYACTRAINVVGRSAPVIVDALVVNGVEELTLTGEIAIWVFHQAVHPFRRVYYDDSKPKGQALIATRYLSSRPTPGPKLSLDLSLAGPSNAAWV